MAPTKPDYETKDLASTPIVKRKKPKPKKEKKYVVISPRGNQYYVKEDELDFFKHVHGVDDAWSIK